MSVTTVTLLAVAGVCCVFVLTALLALLRVAAHSDAQLEREGEFERERRASLALQPELPPTGRFARRRERLPDSGDRPLVR